MTTPCRFIRPGRLVAVGVIVLVVAGAGCTRSPVEQAVSGKFTPEKNNKIITSYCTSCHTHKDFQPDPHVALVSTWYEKKPYQGATECRTCHRIKLKGVAIPWVQRTTRRPHGRLTPLARQVKPPPPPSAQ